MKKFEELSPNVIIMAVFILSMSFFLLVRILQPWLYRTVDIDTYLVFHNIAEFFSVMVSLSIFGAGWYTCDQSKNRHVLFIGCAFLGIGLMDFMHTLAYPGMPDLLTPNSANKSTQFWIVVRLFAAAAFLTSAFIYKDNTWRWLTKRYMLTAVLVISALTFIGITYYPSHLPATFIEGSGLTPFKIYSEYLIIGLLAVAFAAYWKRFKRTGDKLLIFYLAAFIVCIFSELAFTLYECAFDTYNALGHIYKVIAFFLIYQGLFIAAVKHPYKEVVDMSKEYMLFENIVENMGDEVYLLQKNGVIAYVNDAAAKNIGYTKDELLNMKIQDIDPIYDQNTWDSLFEELKQNRIVKSLETQHRRKDGVISEKGINTIYIRFYTEEYILAIIRDITRRKQTGKALKESERKFKSLFEDSPISISVEDFSDIKAHFKDLKHKGVDNIREYFNTHPGMVLNYLKMVKIIDVNKATLRLYKANNLEEYLSGFSRIYIKESYDVFKEALISIYEDNTKFESEVIAHTLTGEKIYTNIKWSNLPENEETPTRTLVMIEDITLRKQAEALIINERNQAQQYLDISGVMLIALDENGAVTLINKKGCQILGYDESEILNKNWFDLCIPVEVRREIREVFGKLMAGEIAPVEYYENFVITSLGEERIIAFHNSVIRNEESRITGILFSGEDITERRQAEDKIRKLNQALEQRVLERTVELEKKNTELEKMNKLFVGREVRMAELKEHIAELENDVEGG